MTLGVGVGIGFYRDIIAFAIKKADPEMLRARFGISPTTARRNGLARPGTAIGRGFMQVLSLNSPWPNSYYLSDMRVTRQLGDLTRSALFS
jgi:hypothetical protein